MGLKQKLPVHPSWIIAVIVFIMPLSGASVDIYVPSLPYIANYFHVGSTQAQISVGIFLVSYGVFQLFFGTLSDAIGRRKVLIFGTLLYLVAALGSALSPNIYFLWAMRVLQGMATASCGGVVRAISPDVFEGADYLKATNYSTIAWASGPIIAPFIGGYLQHYIGWRAPFFFLAIYGLLISALVFFILPETNLNKKTMRISDFLQNSKQILSDKRFIGGFLVAGLLYGGILVFNTLGPFLIQVELHKSAIYFGHIALLMGLGYFLGNLTNRFLIHRDHRLRILISLLALLAGSIALIMFAAINLMTPWTISLPVLIMLFFNGIIFPNVYGACIRMHTHISGTVSAVFGFCMAALAGLTSLLVSPLHTTTLWPFSLSYLLIAILIWIAYFGFFTKTKN